jgi:hypothetical protein
MSYLPTVKNRKNKAVEPDRNQQIVAKYTRSDSTAIRSYPKAQFVSVYRITRHARERYLQRFSNLSKYKHIDSCPQRDTCKHCHSLRIALKQLADDQRFEVDKEIERRINQAKEERSYINNTELMLRLWEEYGYDSRFRFLRDQDAVFVIGQNGPIQTVITVLPMGSPIGKQISVHVKFRKKDKGRLPQPEPEEETYIADR